MVEGVTKLGQITWPGRGRRDRRTTQMQAENLRKMFLAMAQDLRVVIIKLADRLHNMRTLWALRPERPAAHRPGDDGDLRAAGRPPRHLGDEVAAGRPRLPLPGARAVQARRRDARRRSAESASSTSRRSARSCATSWPSRAIKAEIHGRAKHIYSIHQKIEKYADEGRDVDEIYDLLAVRILVDTVTDCYTRAGHRARAVAAAARHVRRLHRQPEGEHVPVAAHDGDGAGRAAAGGADPHLRDAPRAPSTASRRTGATRRAASATSTTRSGSPGCASSWTGSARSPRRKSWSRR